MQSTPNFKPRIRECVLCEQPLDADNIAHLRCPKCLAWQPNAEETETAEHVDTTKDKLPGLEDDGTILLSDVTEAEYKKIQTGPWDKCFGGSDKPGIVVTGVYLIGGPPGAGKSTLALQLGDAICEATKEEILYIGAEEAVREIKPRAVRVGVRHFNKFRVVPLGVQADLVSVLRKRKPRAMVIDSLQKWSDDLEEQVRICEALKPLAVELECPILIISQLTKDDDFAGLRKLQHAVDCTILFNVFDDDVRSLESTKNRYGDTCGELFDMTATGLSLRLEDDEDEEELDEDE